MDVTDWLKVVTGRCHLVVSPQQAIRLAPDIALDAPPLWNQATGLGGASDFIIPVACTEVLAGPASLFLSARFADVLNAGGREAFFARDASTWMEDPLVSTLTLLLLEAHDIAPRLTSIPLLELSRIVSTLLAGQLPKGMSSSDTTRAIDRNMKRFRDQPPARRGTFSSEIAWSLAARISAAWTCASAANSAVRPGRFYQAMLLSRMALVIPAPPLGNPSVLDTMSMLAIPGDPTLVEKILQVSEVGLKNMEARKETGHATSADLAFLGALVPEELTGLSKDERAHRLCREPDVVCALLHSLGDLVPAKVFSQYQLSREQARVLTSHENVEPLVRSVRDLLQGMLRWDLFSAIVSFLEPVGPELTVGVQDDSAWMPVSPRTSPFFDAAVVAVRLSEIRETVAMMSSTEALLPHALEALLQQQMRSVQEAGGIVVDLGSHALFVFRSTKAALDAAFSVVSALFPPIKVVLAPREGVMEIPKGATVSAGLAAGRLRGGGDGENFRFWGLAVDEAIRLAGSGAVREINDDPLGVRHSTLSEGRLSSTGVVAARTFVEWHRIQETAARRVFRGLGSRVMVASIDSDFRHYPVVFAQEAPLGKITLMVGLSRSEDAPFEVLRITQSEFQEFHTLDVRLASSVTPVKIGRTGARGAAAPKTSSAPAPPDHYDPFRDPEQSPRSDESGAASHYGPDPTYESTEPLPPQPTLPSDERTPESVATEIEFDDEEEGLEDAAAEVSEDFGQYGTTDEPEVVEALGRPPIVEEQDEGEESKAFVGGMEVDAIGETESDEDYETDKGGGVFESDPGFTGADEAVLLEGSKESPPIRKTRPAATPPPSTENELAYLPPALKGSVARFRPRGSGAARTSAGSPPAGPAKQPVAHPTMTQDLVAPPDTSGFDATSQVDDLSSEPSSVSSPFKLSGRNSSRSSSRKKAATQGITPAPSSSPRAQRDQEPDLRDLLGPETDSFGQDPADFSFLDEAAMPAGASGEASSFQNRESPANIEPPARREPIRRQKKRVASAQDLKTLFAGYHTWRQADGLLVGHIYGKHVLDAHFYPASLQGEDVYTAFLTDKIAEGFVLRSDLLRALPEEVAEEPLDFDLLRSAFDALAGT